MAVNIDLTDDLNRVIVQGIIDTHKALILTDTGVAYDPDEVLSPEIQDYENKVIVRELEAAMLS